MTDKYNAKDSLCYNMVDMIIAWIVQVESQALTPGYGQCTMAVDWSHIRSLYFHLLGYKM